MTTQLTRAELERALTATLDYYREMEILISMLVIQHGQQHDGGHRLILPGELAARLREEIIATEPVVIHRYQPDEHQYVIDVL